MSENKKVTNQNEFEINTPHKENEEITTNGQQTGFQTVEINQENKETQNSKLTENGQKKNDQQNNEQQKRIDNDKEREERKNPDDAKYQDADWQRDKINEANNEDGNPVDGKGKANQNAEKGVDKEANVSDKDKEKGEHGDTRKDSIIDRPKTETYEKKINEDTSKAIYEGNYQHTKEEEKRQRENKKENIPQ